MKKIICISGDLGSGKSTVGKIVADTLGYEYYSTGMVFRQLAESMGRTVHELNILSETDPSIDDMIDSRLAQMGREKEEVVLDSRMAWHFVKEGFNVYMTVDADEAARRVMKTYRGLSENYSSMEEAREGLKLRREAEAKRYLEKYKVDICSRDNYHYVIDTTYRSPNEIAEMIIEAYRNILNR